MIRRDHPYKNVNLAGAMQKLPMEEFCAGNFSKAQAIIDVCKDFIANTKISLIYSLTDGLGDIDQYHQQELAKLQPEYDQKVKEKANAVQQINDLKQEIADEKLALKNQGNGDKSRVAFYNFIEKVSENKNTFDGGFALKDLMSAFEKIKEEQPEKYKETKDLFEKFIASAHICIDNLITINGSVIKQKMERKKITSIVSGERNYFNLEGQIERIKHSEARKQMEYRIEKEICEIFGQIDNVGNYTIDKRSTNAIFTELVTTNLVVNHKTNKSTKLRLIKNHPNKVDLWEYLSGIYDDSIVSRNPIFSLNINTGRYTDQRLSIYEARDTMIEQIVAFAKKSLENLSDISRVWYDPVLVDASHQEEENFGLQKVQLIDSLLSHLREKLYQNDAGSFREQDPKIKKLFEVMYFEHDTHEFEEICKKIWNADALLYGNMILVELEFLMKEVYKNMNQEEREYVHNYYGYAANISSILDAVNKEEKLSAGEQLSLFTVPPIYKIDRYIDEVVDHIQSSLGGRLSYKQKSLLAYVISELMIGKGFDKFDTKDPIPTFSDEEFLEVLKHTKNGKALSEKIKKKNISIFLDIENRIKKETTD